MWETIENECDICIFSRKKKYYTESDDQTLQKEDLLPEKNDDVSFFESTTIIRSTCTSNTSSHYPNRRYINEIDSSSRDSGYGMSYQNDDEGESSSSTSPKLRSFDYGSLSSSCIEDDFLEDFSDIEPLDKIPRLPSDFNKLITAPLVIQAETSNNSSPEETSIRPLFRRALSLQNTTPSSSRVRTTLFRNEPKDNKENRSFKRPEPPTTLDSTVVKKGKFIDDNLENSQLTSTRPFLKRAISATEESIMCAVQKSSIEPNLIGDFTKTVCLPLTNGKHKDLKAITAETLARLIKGEFSDTVESFKVIDCRYPYEYKGGHIDGAINVFTKEQINELLEENQVPVTSLFKRQILVFHCEFSSERGPNLYRYLRKEDRQRNMDLYPALHYPEMYLLEGGYKRFFKHFPNMCVPVAYKEMLHPDHEEDLRHFRQKSKTWNSDQRSRPTRSFKRL